MMKAVLSQTIFAGGAHIHGKIGGRLYADLDANGWPQSGRRRALEKIRKSFSIMIAGDQHLATIIHHGIEDWNDAGYSFCVPSIANYYLRWWKPINTGNNRISGPLEYTGEFLDGFNNKITMHAYANPSEDQENKKSSRGEGFGVIRFNKNTRDITFECYKRDVEIQNEKSQYQGWPFTINQFDNYKIKGDYFLPKIISNLPDPVIQIVNAVDDATIYSVRIKGFEYIPRLKMPGLYTVKIGLPENDIWKTFNGIEAVESENKNNLNVEF
jgi:hypothetical protein